MRLRSTHTFAELEVSEESYEEIARLLREAGYWHVFMDSGAIDMQGIGLTKGKSKRCETLMCVCGHSIDVHGLIKGCTERAGSGAKCVCMRFRQEVKRGL